jgi:hypothetical protein
VIVAQQREISRLRRIVAYQARVIRYQAGVIRYYKNITNVLGFRLWGHDPGYYGYVMNSIHSLRGIPAGAFDHDMISKLQGIISGLGGLAQGGRVGRPADQAYAAMRADKERVATSSRIAGMRADIGAYQAWINDLHAEMELREICADSIVACGMATDPDHHSGFTPGDVATFIVSNGPTCLEYGSIGATVGTAFPQFGGPPVFAVVGCVGSVGIGSLIGTQA